MMNRHELKNHPRRYTSRIQRLGVESLEDRRVMSADPGWLAGIGGAGNDAANKVVVDGENNTYVAGTFAGIVDFDPGPGVANQTSLGLNDTFVAKYSSTGVLLWAHRLGGNNDTTVNDSAKGLVVDALGHGGG